jgi:hypothetical protein
VVPGVLDVKKEVETVKGSKGKRVLSQDARRRMVEAGRATGTSNLLGWREKHDTRAIALEQEVNAFREKLLAECGSNRSATRLALVEATVVTYASLQRLLHSVVNGPKKKLLDVTERVSWLTSNQARLLKALDLSRKPRPRTLQEALDQKAAQTGENERARPPIPTESGGKPV